MHVRLKGRKGIRPVKKNGGGGGRHWLVRMEWHPVGWSVCLPLLICPCTVKSISSLLAPAHPGGPGKRAVKWLWCGVACQFEDQLLTSEASVTSHKASCAHSPFVICEALQVELL